MLLKLMRPLLSVLFVVLATRYVIIYLFFRLYEFIKKISPFDILNHVVIFILAIMAGKGLIVLAQRINQNYSRLSIRLIGMIIGFAGGLYILFLSYPLAIIYIFWGIYIGYTSQPKEIIDLRNEPKVEIESPVVYLALEWIHSPMYKVILAIGCIFFGWGTEYLLNTNLMFSKFSVAFVPDSEAQAMVFWSLLKAYMISLIPTIVLGLSAMQLLPRQYLKPGAIIPAIFYGLFGSGYVISALFLFNDRVGWLFLSNLFLACLTILYFKYLKNNQKEGRAKLESIPIELES
ncbi:MAG: hypothetical protein KDC49_07980 [Saprospiraceae bacterium]|nr:hypothetical protein [Saprospiraceae bacterium]